MQVCACAEAAASKLSRLAWVDLCSCYDCRFQQYTIDQFEAVKQLHIILLVVTLVGLVAFVFMVFRPYVAKLRSESKVFAGARGCEQATGVHVGKWTQPSQVVCAIHVA
jgi:hypothetical protein